MGGVVTDGVMLPDTLALPSLRETRAWELVKEFEQKSHGGTVRDAVPLHRERKDLVLIRDAAEMRNRARRNCWSPSRCQSQLPSPAD